MDKKQFAAFLRAQLSDKTLNALRVQTSALVADGMTKSGDILWTWAHISHDKDAEGAAMAMQMCGEVAQGALALLEAGIWYAACGPLRQLIEAGYLVARFADDPTQGSAWLRATNEDLRKKWTPAELRKSLDPRFRDEEYWTHCTWGGHPTPTVRWLLKNHSEIVDRRFLLADLTKHLSNTWPDIERCLASHGLLEQSTEKIIAARDALARWKEHDVLSQELVIDEHGAFIGDS